MIRKMSKADIPAALALEQASFDAPWSRGSFEFELESNPYARAFVLEDEDGFAGFAIVWITFETAQLVNIAVDPQKRGQGLGRKLLDAVLEKAVQE
jgi:ribosomal-protein-alanine N-acetyltransferase